MKEKITYEITGEDIGRFWKEGEKIIIDGFLNKWDAVIVGSRTACEVLLITEKTLRRYVDAGVVKCHARGEKELYKFSLRYLLSLDRDEIKRRYRYNIIQES